MADEVRAQISDQELRDLQAELEQARSASQAKNKTIDGLHDLREQLQARIAELEAEAKIRHTIKVQPHINDALDQVDEALRDVLPWGEYQQAVDVLIKLRKS
jgi:predicted  nucleic acid-binding Zn-ribbon protein